MNYFVDDNSTEAERIANFKKWLLDNGAKFPKIDWPRSDTVSGIRGAIALDDITTNEYMLEIPIHLMMSPPQILQGDGELSRALHSSSELLVGDLLLTIYIMHECVKGKDSFYYPYLAILPIPLCTSEWSDEELHLLQDEKMYLRAKNRQLFLRRIYQRSICHLSEQYPDLFPTTSYTYEVFKFAYNTIQARAFGRRLPWTALVPFADCLNHSNVQTKYDYHIDKNGMFRLYPTGENHYIQGYEVFNSYGKRANDNLLMDYGFAMMGNEWDEVEYSLCLSRDDMQYEWKSHILLSMGYYATKVFPLRLLPSNLSSILMFLRVIHTPTVLLEGIITPLLQPGEEEDLLAANNTSKKYLGREYFDQHKELITGLSEQYMHCVNFTLEEHILFEYLMVLQMKLLGGLHVYSSSPHHSLGVMGKMTSIEQDDDLLDQLHHYHNDKNKTEEGFSKFQQHVIDAHRPEGLKKKAIEEEEEILKDFQQIECSQDEDQVEDEGLLFVTPSEGSVSNNKNSHSHSHSASQHSINNDDVNFKTSHSFDDETQGKEVEEDEDYVQIQHDRYLLWETDMQAVNETSHPAYLDNLHSALTYRMTKKLILLKHVTVVNMLLFLVRLLKRNYKDRQALELEETTTVFQKLADLSLESANNGKTAVKIDAQATECMGYLQDDILLLPIEDSTTTDYDREVTGWINLLWLVGISRQAVSKEWQGLMKPLLTHPTHQQQDPKKVLEILAKAQTQLVQQLQQHKLIRCEGISNKEADDRLAWSKYLLSYYNMRK